LKANGHPGLPPDPGPRIIPPGCVPTPGMAANDFSHNLRLEWSSNMTPTDQVATPSGHTPEGGVLVGNANARHEMILYEDPQCPFCRQFEELNGPVLTAAVSAGSLAVEYRMRCFLGAESVRADNALALAAEAGRYEKWVLGRETLYQAQDPQGTPAAWLDGDPLDSEVLFDTGLLERRLRT
jgi:hypothetical protein